MVEEVMVNDVPVLSKDEINQEINQSMIERREIDFSGKTLEYLSLSEKNINYGLNLQNCRILGNFFLADVIINGNVNLMGSTVEGSLFFGRGRVIGNLDMRKITANQTVNLVGLNVTGSLLFSEAKIGGFISLAKAVILGDVDLENTQASDYTHNNLSVKGDIYLKNAQINGLLNLNFAQISGGINLEGALIRKKFSAKNLNVGYQLITRNAIFNEGEADFEGIPPEKIIR